MKRGIFVLLLLLLLPSVLSVEVSLSKNVFYPRETLQAEFSGNFLTLEHDNIFIYEQGIPRPEPVISGFTRQGYKYYYYAVLPNKQGNFSLKIQDSRYTDSGITKSDDIVMDFEIKSGNITEGSKLAVDKGFVVTSKVFSINLISLKGDQEVTAFIESSNQSKTVYLIEDVEKKLEFNPPEENTVLKIKDYEIPIFVISKTNDTRGDNESNVSDNKIHLEFSPDELSGVVAVGEDYSFIVILENKGSEDIDNIVLSSDIGTINPKSIKSLKVGNSTFFNLTISVSKNENISGRITLDFDDKSETIPVFLETTENKTKVDLNRTTISDLHCTEMRGKICDYGETCTGETTRSLEGPCCIGSCIVEEETNYNWAYGIALIGVLAFLGFMVYKKMKKQKQGKTKTPDDIIKDKTKKYKERMQGGPPPPKEVKKSLRKV